MSKYCLQTLKQTWKTTPMTYSGGKLDLQFINISKLNQSISTSLLIVLPRPPASNPRQVCLSVHLKSRRVCSNSKRGSKPTLAPELNSNCNLPNLILQQSCFNRLTYLHYNPLVPTTQQLYNSHGMRYGLAPSHPVPKSGNPSNTKKEPPRESPWDFQSPSHHYWPFAE